MKGIRRFQRTMIVALVGLNILVFSSSFYGDFSAAIGHALIGMTVTGIGLLGISLLRRNQIKKKSTEGILQSREN